MANASKISEIFDKMDIGTNVDGANNAKVWLENKQRELAKECQEQCEKLDVFNANNGEKLITLNKLSQQALDDILNLPNKLSELGGEKREQLLLNFSTSIEQSSTVITELEILARGILANDTKTKSLPLLIDCLKYYSTWAVLESDIPQAKGSLCCILSDSTYLGSLGWLLGPALAKGFNVILQTSSKMSVIAMFLAELSVKAGFPYSSIQVIPEDKVDLKCLNHNSVKYVSICDNIYNYEKCNNVPRKIFFNILDNKTPMIVFNGADLDSACNTAIEAVWGYQGQLPWSIDTILVQEDVLEAFITKMKYKLDNIKIGHGDDKVVDVAYPIKAKSSEKLENIVKDALKQGITVYQASSDNGKFKPTLLIGGQVYGNNVLTENKIDIPVATIVGFRTTNEVVSLANNRKSGFAATVFTENLGLANEISKKLNVATIWINGYGIFTPGNPTSSLKFGGIGYLGGKDGFIQFCTKENPPKVNYETPAECEPQTPSSGKDFHNMVLTAKKGFTEWQKRTTFDRVKSLIKLSNELDKIKDKLSVTYNIEWIINWINALKMPYCAVNDFNETSYKTYELKSLRKPLGAVVIEASYGYAEYPINFVVSSLVYGNSVILLNNDGYAVPFYQEISKLLSSAKIPTGVLNIMFNNGDVRTAAVVHKEIGIYIANTDNCKFAEIPLQERQKLRIVNPETSLEDAARMVTFLKNIWSNCGQSIL